MILTPTLMMALTKLPPLAIRCTTKGWQRSRCRLPAVCQKTVNFPFTAPFHCSAVRLGDSVFMDQDLAAFTKKEAATIMFPLQYAEFTTSHSSSSQNKLAGGLKFKAAYIDTHPGADASMPTVVTLHGAPGSHVDFRHIINFLPKHNIRVIALNFPGYYWTPMDAGDKFQHIAVEKTAFLKDFLEAVKISKIDILIAHSAGTYPATLLCADTNMARGLFFINPTGHRFMGSLNKWWYYFKAHRDLCRIPILRPFMLMILKLWILSTKFPNKDPVLVSAQLETMTQLDYELHQQATRNVASKKMPVFVMYGEKDRIMESEISAEFALMLGGSPELMQHYDSEAKVLQPIAAKGVDRIFRGYVFKKDGHFLMKRHPDVVNQAILDLYYSMNEK